MTDTNTSEKHNIELEKAIAKECLQYGIYIKNKKYNVLNFIDTQIGNKNIKAVTEIKNQIAVISEEEKMEMK